MIRQLIRRYRGGHFKRIVLFLCCGVLVFGFTSSGKAFTFILTNLEEPGNSRRLHVCRAINYGIQGVFYILKDRLVSPACPCDISMRKVIFNENIDNGDLQVLINNVRIQPSQSVASFNIKFVLRHNPDNISFDETLEVRNVHYTQRSITRASARRIQSDVMKFLFQNIRNNLDSVVNLPGFNHGHGSTDCREYLDNKFAEIQDNLQ